MIIWSLEGEVQVDGQSAKRKSSIDTPTNLYAADGSVLIRYVNMSDPYVLLALNSEKVLKQADRK
jgi:hypothetical protein